jgi:HK97 family phage major capsid protein
VAESAFTNWIPVEYGTQVIQKVTQTSAIENYGQQVMMTSSSRYVARDGGVSATLVQKGQTYNEDATGGTSVLLTAGKWGAQVRIAEEDIMDSLADIINSKANALGTAMAKVFDNAAIGINAAPGVTNAQTTSVYYGLTNSDANTGYTANANYFQTGAGSAGAFQTTGSAPNYTTGADLVSSVLGAVEQGDYFNEEDMIWIAHPYWRKQLRGVKDAQGRPIFDEGSTGFPGGAQGPTPDRVFNVPVFWSLGAVVTSSPTSTPPAYTGTSSSGSAPSGTAGNRLMVACNRLYAIAGKRTTNPQNPGGTPEFQIVPPMYSGTDDTILRGRMRRAFSMGVEQAFAILESTA